MSLLGKYVKQSAEALDYDVDYTDWFQGRVGTPAAVSAFADAGINIVSTAIIGYVVKVVLSGGVTGNTYKVTVRLATTDGLLKEIDFAVAVKDD